MNFTNSCKTLFFFILPFSFRSITVLRLPFCHLRMADNHQISHKVTVDFTEGSCQASQTEFSEAEIDLIARIYKLIGKRWSLIAGRIPGRTAEEIEKYCTPMFEKSG
ncbi:Transcription factor CPC [Platanthera zijinensis]|uniref:Transcription factor CPC n=1 Tax=Platanthera zijinensis TaxID=2320716 RepID=A0AAP0GEA1_9ASPA